MEFSKIHAGIDLDCITDDVVENVKDVFTRKIISNSLQENDFMSYWELGKRMQYEPKTKDEICKYRGISINLYENDENIEEYYKKIFRKVGQFKPKKIKPKFYCKFKFKNNAGKVWQNGYEKPYHCTFFKCDTFEINLIDVIEIKEF